MTLLLHGGEVFDSAKRELSHRDVLVDGAEVVAITAPGEAHDTERSVDVSGSIVSPGLIDIHAHVWGEPSVDADRYHLQRGVTTIVDAGSAGSNTFGKFNRYVIESAETRVLAFLNISGMGILDLDIGELEDIRWARPDRAVDTIRAFPQTIVGIKVRLSSPITGSNGAEALARGIEAASDAGVPVMVHIGATGFLALEAILGKLRPGDIMTHSYTSYPPGILVDGTRILDEAVNARERGVLFDVGHGAGSFAYEVAEPALELGFAPDTISTDLHKRGIHGPVYDLTTTMSKFLGLGIRVEDVLDMVTGRPASAINRQGDLGSLHVGGPADITVMKLETGRFEFYDAVGQSRTSPLRLAPTAVVRASAYHPLEGAIAGDIDA